MVDSFELEARGWMRVRGVANRSNLLELARSIGCPVPAPTGELVKELTVKGNAAARKGTFSGIYGEGQFPLHTDTAFWPRPSRYIVLRACGDIRRCTTVLKFQDLVSEKDAELGAVNRSVWLLRTPSRAFYCSLRFRSENASGWRYDSQCMSPANEAARNAKHVLEYQLTRLRPECINWSPGLAVILCNWVVLHGRGPAPPDEGGRILERIYVE
jgi:hypothetical protein